MKRLAAKGIPLHDYQSLPDRSARRTSATLTDASRLRRSDALSVFQLSLMTTPTPQPSPASVRPLVLVADDDESLRALIVAVLHQIDVGVLVASNGAAAVQLVLEHGTVLCCAILDVCMPVMDGIEAARTIRALTPSLPIIMMSSDFPAGYRQQIAPLRIALVLDKPFRLSELRRVVQGFSEAAAP